MLQGLDSHVLDWYMSATSFIRVWGNTTQDDLRGLFTNAKMFLDQIIDTEGVCVNCLSVEHLTDQCPVAGAANWKKLLIGARDGLVARNTASGSADATVDTSTADIVIDSSPADVVIDLVEEEQPREVKYEVVTFHHESVPLQELVGEDELSSTFVGGRDPRKISYRNKERFFDMIDQHLRDTRYVPQRGHLTNLNQYGMTKYASWTDRVLYGQIEPLLSKMAVFSDPVWGDTRFIGTELGRKYNHSAMQQYTRRWSKVLRHDIGHEGRAATCDELGWVSVEEFVRNDHAWPMADGSIYNHDGSIDEELLQDRRNTLMEGYWYILNKKPVKRRIMIVVQRASPGDMEAIKMHEQENKEFFTAEKMFMNDGYVRPIAIRATSGHFFSGDHKYRLAVNIDFPNMNIKFKFTRELAFNVGGGYHVTHVGALLSIVKKGLIPGGVTGGRDHVFFGEYAPWDPINSCTLAYLGQDIEQLLVLYVPASRLLKYKSSYTYNGDVIVREVVPFHEVQEMWIAGKSTRIGNPAQNPRKIMSSGIVDEVVCQCELADRSVPSAIVRSVVDKLVAEAKDKGRSDLIDALEQCWDPFMRNHNNGIAAANLGAQIVLARYELFPIECSRNRLCPNCMMTCPKTLLSCPQCKGQFISSGMVNRSAPVEITLSREEINQAIKEKEDILKNADFPVEDEVARQEVIVIADEPRVEAGFKEKPKDAEKTTQESKAEEEPANPTTDVTDEFKSWSINHERLKKDLEDYAEMPAFTIDDQLPACRFIIFKIADYVVNAYPPWKRFRLEITDEGRAKSLSTGNRHDVTGSGHPVLRSEDGVLGFAMYNGVPVTVDDETYRNHFQAKFENGTSRYDGEEMLRRYRFSVIVTKLIEALYRRGHELDGHFKHMVKVCNSVSDDPGSETTISRDEVAKYGEFVKDAMGEAIKIALGAETYCFFSKERRIENYAFDFKDLQSYVAAKAGGKLTAEMAHVMHYYAVDPVPVMRALMDLHKHKPDAKPVHLKFLKDTPLVFYRGLNMLMPATLNPEAVGQDDVVMVKEETEENATPMEVEEVSAFPDPIVPEPPLEPIVEDGPEEDEEMEEVVEERPTAPASSAVSEEVPKVTTTKGLFSDQPMAKGPPIVLKPAVPAEAPTIMQARPKPMPKASSTQPTSEPAGEVKPKPRPKSPAPKEAAAKEKAKEPSKAEGTTETRRVELRSASSSTGVEVKIEPEPVGPKSPRMTSEVRQVPKRLEPKARPEQPNPSAPSEATSTYASSTVELTPIVRDMPNVEQGDALWNRYTPGAGSTDPQYVEVGENTHRTPPPPPRPRREGTGASASEVVDVEREDHRPQKGRGRGKSTWQPVRDPHSGAEMLEGGGRRARFANNQDDPEPTQAKGRGKGYHQGKGHQQGKGKHGKGKRSYRTWGTYDIALDYEGYVTTGLWGEASQLRSEFRYRFPNEYDQSLSNFWMDENDSQWYVWRNRG